MKVKKLISTPLLALGGNQEPVKHYILCYENLNRVDVWLDVVEWIGNPKQPIDPKLKKNVLLPTGTLVKDIGCDAFYDRHNFSCNLYIFTNEDEVYYINLRADGFFGDLQKLNLAPIAGMSNFIGTMLFLTKDCRQVFNHSVIHGTSGCQKQQDLNISLLHGFSVKEFVTSNHPPMKDVGSFMNTSSRTLSIGNMDHLAPEYFILATHKTQPSRFHSRRILDKKWVGEDFKNISRLVKLPKGTMIVTPSSWHYCHIGKARKQKIILFWVEVVSLPCGGLDCFLHFISTRLRTRLQNIALCEG